MTSLSSIVNTQGRVAVGTIVPSGAALPSGYLACDGSAVSRTTYARLFAAIGTTYGVGDGSTTFNLPNTQGLFTRGSGSQTVSAKSFNGGALGNRARDKTGQNGLSASTTSTPSLSLSNTDLTHTHSYNDLTTNFTSFSVDIFDYDAGNPGMINPTNLTEADTTGSSLGVHSHTVTPSITSIVTSLSGSTESKPASLTVTHMIKY